MRSLETYPVELTTFRHGAVALELAAAPDLDALLTDDTDPERIPYWAVVWPSAPLLARRLLDGADWRGAEVLELGCGAGLVGLSLAAGGARVLQTDLFAEAAGLARNNARRNGLEQVRHAVADWGAWPFRGRWPVVLGSDLLYERRSHPLLLEVLARSLAPGGTAYLADPGRPMSACFPDLARAEGWNVETQAIGVDLHVLRRSPTER